MKEKISILVYFVLFLSLSIAVSGILFLFAFPLSILVLLGLFAWAAGETIRALVPSTIRLYRRAAFAMKSRLADGVMPVSDIESGRHASVQNLVFLRRRRGYETGSEGDSREFKLRRTQSARKPKGLHRFAFHALRRPHHAHSHSR